MVPSYRSDKTVPIFSSVISLFRVRSPKMGAYCSLAANVSYALYLALKVAKLSPYFRPPNISSGIPKGDSSSFFIHEGSLFLTKRVSTKAQVDAFRASLTNVVLAGAQCRQMMSRL